MTTDRHLDILRKVVNLAFWVLCLLVTMVFFYLAPRLEILMFPIISEFTIDHIEKTDEGTLISGVLVKEREDCRAVEVSATTEYRNREYPSKIMKIETETDEARPAGAQYYGPWKLKSPGPPLGPVLIIRKHHRCHFLWEDTTTLYTGPTVDFFSHQEIEGTPPWVEDQK